MYSILLNFLDEEQARLITLMVSSIPISFLLSRLRNKYLILAVSITFSVLFQSIMFPTQKYLLWVQQLIVYILLGFAPRKHVGKIILIQSLLHLCLVQIRRMYISYAVNGVDITGILMMQTFLYVGLAYNYQNGLKSQDVLTDGANKRKVKEMPDILTYIGYVFFLPSCLVGPVFQFRDFEDYINQKGDYDNIPNTLKPALDELGVFVVSLVIYVGTMTFNLWDTVRPQFANQSYLYKLFYIAAVIFHIQFKYITAWSLGMISVHCSGLSYSKKDHNFQKIRVTKMIGFFFNPSLKIKIQCWNMPVQTALKRYIYDQIYNSKITYPNDKAKKKSQQKAQLSTVFVSALWHGLYPGYFVSFLHWMIYLRMIQQLYRLRKVNDFVDSLWKKYKFDIFESFLSGYVLLLFGIFFHIMTWENIKAILYATYGIPFFVLYVLYFVIYKAQILSKGKHKKLNNVNTQNGKASQTSSDINQRKNL